MLAMLVTDRTTKVLLVEYVGEICMLVKTRYVGEKLSATLSQKTFPNVGEGMFVKSYGGEEKYVGEKFPDVGEEKRNDLRCPGAACW